MSDYHIKSLPDAQFIALYKAYYDQFFTSKSQLFDYTATLSEQAISKISGLQANMGSPTRINLVIYYRDTCIGWSWGFQESAWDFYMCNSAIAPAHRRKGLYTKLMQEMMRRAETMGFQVIYGRHVATNNAVIIPKLKAGFIITAMEVSDRFGTLVHLTYYTDPVRRKIQDYRVGFIEADDEIRHYLGLNDGRK